MSKRDRYKDRDELKPTNIAKKDDDLLFTSDASASDVWGNLPDTPARDVTDDIYGAPRTGKNVLQLDSDGVYRFGRVELTSVGLALPDDVSLDEYMALGRVLMDVGSRIQWLLGDFVVYGDHFEWGETYEQLASEFGYEVQTLRDYAYVCRNVDLSIRIDTLTFGHHQVVSALDEEDQARWLNRAAIGDGEKRWSIKRMREEINGGQKQLTGPSSPLDRETDRLAKLVGSAAKLDSTARHQLVAMMREAADRIEEMDRM